MAVARKTKATKQVEELEGIQRDFVFMDKSINILDIGLKTGKNIVMYGPGGHGKSELTMAYLAEKGIDPYVITMGTGMTTDRLFGGLDIPTFEKTGKIEYLVENSFMNNEYVIFEELFDAPDFILEQLKDILSSKIFRNGTQIFPIKTKFIICCTNRTREEFSKNASLKALMERFPLELNVIWDNYNEASYNKLLETKFGQGNVDPIIPFLLQEYHRGGVTISPRVAVTAYQVYEECGPDSLNFIAEFAKKPALITDTLKKYQNTLKFRKLSSDLDAIVRDLQANNLVTDDEKNEFNNGIGLLASNIKDIKKLTVSDDLAATHASLIKSATDLYTKLSKKQTVSSIME
jgi:MoxR-like ATPase